MKGPILPGRERRYRPLLTALALALLSLFFRREAASGHPLNLNTAQISLRDGQLAIMLHVDLVQLMAALASTGTPFPASLASASDPEHFPARLAGSDEATLQAALQATAGVLSRDIHLLADGQPVRLQTGALPSADELRAMAGMSAMGLHGELPAIRLDGLQVSRPPHTVALQLPPALGPVLITFVQPASQTIAPGGSALFQVLSTPHLGQDSPSSPVNTWPAPLTVVAAVLAMLAIGANLLLLTRADPRLELGRRMPDRPETDAPVSAISPRKDE